jgi:MFS family permease
MRRLLLLCCAIVAVDTVFYAVLTPLLPHYAHRYGLSKAEAGALVAAYAAGGLVAGIPAGIAAARFGAKRAAMTGLTLVALASIGFALAGSPWLLGAMRFCQGLGSMFSWAGGLAWLVGAAPRERRGEVLGTAMGAAVFGAMLGPVLGGAAGIVGVRAAFFFVTALALVLLAIAAATPPAEPEPVEPGDAARAVRSRTLLAALWLIVLPALLFGTLIVLVPLRLDHAGWGTVAIGAVFLALTTLEAVLNPLLGRLTDRRGRLLPVAIALVASLLVSLGLAWARAPALVVALALAAGVAYGAFYTPGLALVSDAAERLGLAQGLAFGVMNSGWAVGAIAGPAAAGALAQLAGDTVPYLCTAAVCVLTLAALRPRAFERAASSPSTP